MRAWKAHRRRVRCPDAEIGDGHPCAATIDGACDTRPEATRAIAAAGAHIAHARPPRRRRALAGVDDESAIVGQGAPSFRRAEGTAMRASMLGIAALAGLCVARSAVAQCAEGSNWTQSWTDSYGQTTYSLTAPCKVYIGVPFDVVATVTDAAYPNDDVGYGWAIVDNGTVVAGGGILAWITTSGGQWQQILTQTYTGVAINHTIQFEFTDLGQGAGAHGWSGSLVGGVTVDPYPVVNAPPAVQVGADVTVASTDLADAIVPAAASDPDGDALAYRWLEGATELQPWRPVGPSGEASLALGAVDLPLGTHVLTDEVTDGAHVAAASATVVVENSPPSVAPTGGGAYRVGRPVLLGGTVSDFDGDALAYRWSLGTAVVSEGSVVAPAGGGPVSLPAVAVGPLRPGSHVFTLSVSDGVHEVEASVAVVVGRPGGAGHRF